MVFTTPMPNANYAVSATSSTWGGFSVADKSVNGFTVFTGNQAGTADVDKNFDVVVHATNAVLPQTVTQEQIDAAIYNPGVSAWGSVTSAGVIEGGLNVQSVTKTGTGVYDVVFSTPMPDANYAVNVTPDYPGGTARTAMVNDKTTTQFTVSIRNTSSTAANEAFNFQVTATNALPLTGGTGADWASTAQCGSTVERWI